MYLLIYLNVTILKKLFNFFIYNSPKQLRKGHLDPLQMIR